MQSEWASPGTVIRNARQRVLIPGTNHLTRVDLGCFHQVTERPSEPRLVFAYFDIYLHTLDLSSCTDLSLSRVSDSFFNITRRQGARRLTDTHRLTLSLADKSGHLSFAVPALTPTLALCD